MEPTTFITLAFNGQQLYVFTKENNWWVAIEPVCNALDFDLETHLRHINMVLRRDLVDVKKLVNAQGHMVKLSFIQEKFFYMWLFTLPVNDYATEKQMWHCYDLLFDFFRYLRVKQK